MTQLLISVRNATEAAVASRFPIGILDLKDPSQGALGAINTEERQRILTELPTDLTKSVALGELFDWPPVATPYSTRLTALTGFQFAKIGLAKMGTCPDWRQRWNNFRIGLPSEVQLVGVAYVDADSCGAPPIQAVLDLVQTQPNGIILLDTFDKSSGSSIDLLGWPGVRSIVAQAHSIDVKIVVAGSIREIDLIEFESCRPDFIGVRGAVCSQGRDRLDEAKLLKFMRTWQRVFSE